VHPESACGGKQQEFPPVDRGKSSTKRPLTNGTGISLTVVVTAANRNDSPSVAATHIGVFAPVR